MVVCEECGVAIRTASVSDDRRKSSTERNPSADENRLRRSALGSHTAVSLQRGTLPSTIFCACTDPIAPIPTIPSLTGSIQMRFLSLYASAQRSLQKITLKAEKHDQTGRETHKELS